MGGEAMIGQEQQSSDSRTKPRMDDHVRPDSPESDVSQNFPDGLYVRPILDADDLQKLTTVRTMDSRTALARGLAEYLRMLSLVWEGGRLLKFARVKFYWAEPEEEGFLPAAAIIGREDAQYEETATGPMLAQAQDGTEKYLRTHAATHQKFDLEVWSTDPVELYGLVAMLEDALEPTEFMNGLRLELPYYFGLRATYLKQSIRYGGGASDAQQRWRKAIISIEGEVSQVVQVGLLQLMDPRITVTVKDPQEL
jgi:hypothetical protein